MFTLSIALIDVAFEWPVGRFECCELLEPDRTETRGKERKGAGRVGAVLRTWGAACCAPGCFGRRGKCGLSLNLNPAICEAIAARGWRMGKVVRGRSA